MPSHKPASGVFAKVKTYTAAHKVTSTVASLIVLYIAYSIYGNLTATPAVTLYVLGSVSQGTISSSVTGSGQVLASDQVTVTPKASGQITAVYVQDGQQVVAGQALAQIDPTLALQSLQTAQSDLHSAQLSLQIQQEPPTALAVSQAQNTIAKDQESQITSETNLTKDYQSGYNDITETYLDLPSLMNGLQDIITGTEATKGHQGNFDYYLNSIQQWDQNAQGYYTSALASYQSAVIAYTTALAAYQQTSQGSSTSTIETTMAQTYTMAQSVATALNSANSFVNEYETVLKNRNQTPNTQADTTLTNLNTYIVKMNTHVSTLLTDTNSLTSDQQAISDSARTIIQDKLSLAQLEAGTDPLSIQSSQLGIQAKEQAVSQAQQTLAEYTIEAPFAGTLGNLNLHKGDIVGSGTAVAVEVSVGDIADLSLNEIDAAKVASGDKVTLTFDAITGLSIAGHVASISPVGTVSQGVVSYDVKIAFDTQDDRIKSGMSVNAAIITAVHTDTLVVPSRAVKTVNNASYVQLVQNPPANSTTSGVTGVALPTPPQQVPVALGISNDTETEILSGVTAGQQIVVQTKTSGATTISAAASATSRIGGGGPVVRGL